MGFLDDNCFLSVLDEQILSNSECFYCGDKDLDDFFYNDSLKYSRQLLGKSYCYRLNDNHKKIVCAFTISNSSIRVDDLPNNRKKKVIKNIPHEKLLHNYPAVLIGRLGVCSDLHSMDIGSMLLNFIKYWFVDRNNKTGCRFLIVDSYNNERAIAFYTKNGFIKVYSSESQEKESRGIDSNNALKTRLMYFDLISISV